LRIRSIGIQGYGRFSDKQLDFASGLQVIVGPNERGKSTIRSFIADMLYGQKVNDTQRVFEESNELRMPWNGNGNYGGELEYELDDGRHIKVVRNFSRKDESVKVIDKASGEEITGSFARFRNRELDFAHQHLGLNKAVFLNAATISHITLDELGDGEALEQIREKLLALTDTGGGNGTVECAMRLLGERVSTIGMSGAAGKPLAQARQTLLALESEYREVLTVREDLVNLAGERKDFVGECRKLRDERQAVEDLSKAIEAFEENRRLVDSEALQESIDAATQRCLALSHVRDISPERDEEVRKLYDVLCAAEGQQRNDQAQREVLDARLRSETGESSGVLRSTAPDFPAALEQQISETAATATQLAGRVTETETLIQAARDRMDDVRQQLTELPDFSRLAADPVEWLSQLANSFAVAQRARDEECATRATLREEVDALVTRNATHHDLFADQDDFPELAREYDVQTRLSETQQNQHASALHSLQGTYAEVQGEARAYRPLGALCLTLSGIMLGIYLYGRNSDLLVFSIVAGFVGLVFTGMWSAHRGHMRRLAASVEEAGEAVKSVAKAADNPSLDRIENMIKNSNLGTLRELEAAYDQYRSTEMELKIRREALTAQEEKASEAEERIPLLLERFRETFAKVGEDISDENDVRDASGRAIARYQEYREAKRRSSSNRSVLERHEAEHARLVTLSAQTDSEVESLERQAREFVAENGLADVDSYESNQQAIAAYRNAFANNREIQGRHDLLGENLREMEQRAQRNAEDVERARAALESAFRPHGVEHMDGWSILMAEAAEYQQLWDERRVHEDKLAEMLGHDTPSELRARVESTEIPDARPEGDRESLRRTIDELNVELEVKKDQEHALHLQITEMSNSMRPLSEIEEEQAILHKKIRSLEAEGEATSYAMALMEDVAQDTHAYVAPRLAEEAGTLLSRITDGAYEEITLGRDLSVRIRIPETQRLHEAPEKSLSQGTVDQIYLALRLAFVQSLNSNGEGVPMLLDDPFANYDDARLATTMALVSELVGRNQVLLFTCREDVVAAAERQAASIIRL
jgi:uncharacterized protein YhaN